MKQHVVENLIAQLNCLSRVSALENAPETQSLAKSLVDTLRYRLTRRDQIVQGGTELAMVESFLRTVALRFEDRFELVITGRALIERRLVPHYVLMTFIENAVYHAFASTDRIRRLTIHAVNRPCVGEGEGTLEVRISDNGIGFVPTDEIVGPNPDAEYGTIASTVHRLSAHYGKPSLQIESRPGEGSTVTITLAGDHE